jgi:hypothetical protein
MKRLICIIVFFLFISNVKSQILLDSAYYNKGLRMIASSKSVQDYINAASYFDALAYKKEDEWLAPLYAALSYTLASYFDSDVTKKDALCDKAQVYIDSANMRHPDIAELTSLQAFLYQARIEVSPKERGLEYALKADAQIKKAETANPNDPRAYFLYAMNVFYTPEIFGGGPKKALPLFEEAALKFENFVPKYPFSPHWGKQQNQDMIAKCKKMLE